MIQPQSPARASSPSDAAPVVVHAGNAVQFDQDAQELQLQERRQWMDQRATLENTRNAMSLQMSQMPAKAAERPLLQAQIADIDARIGKIDGMLGTSKQPEVWAIGNDAFPGVPPFNYQERVLPKDIFLLSAIFTVVVFGPLAIALALRIVKRGKAAILPSGVAERLERMETAIESTAIEVERIGEGQRYLTRLLGDRSGGEELELARVEARHKISLP
jgi:hypothetical protein